MKRFLEVCSLTHHCSALSEFNRISWWPDVTWYVFTNKLRLCWWYMKEKINQWRFVAVWTTTDWPKLRIGVKWADRIMLLSTRWRGSRIYSFSFVFYHSWRANIITYHQSSCFHLICLSCRFTPISARNPKINISIVWSLAKYRLISTRIVLRLYPNELCL